MFLSKEHQEMFTDTKNQHFYTENPFLSFLNRFIESVNSIYILSTLFLVLLIQKYTILMFFSSFLHEASGPFCLMLPATT